MKTLKIIALTSLMALSTNLIAHPSVKLTAKNSSLATDICMAVVSNKPVKLAKLLNRVNMTKARANKNIRCNGFTLTEFGAQHAAHKTVARLKQSNKANELYTRAPYRLKNAHQNR